MSDRRVRLTGNPVNNKGNPVLRGVIMIGFQQTQNIPVKIKFQKSKRFETANEKALLVLNIITSKVQRLSRKRVESLLIRDSKRWLFVILRIMI